MPPTTHSTYNNRRHPTAALTPTLTTATPVASHTTVPEMVPLLPTGPADHYLVSEQKLFTHSENKDWDIFHLYPDLAQCKPFLESRECPFLFRQCNILR